MTLSQAEFNELLEIITSRTGIIPRASHRDGIKLYVEKQLTVLDISYKKYVARLLTESDAFMELVNESTVNETYFFREARQFEFVKNKLFPLWQASFGAKPIKMWSAACSYGEEAYSLAILARSCFMKAEITASDINTNVLAHCQRGRFRSASLRHTDGVSFQHLITPFIQNDGYILFDEQTRAMISTRCLNLAELDSPLMEARLPRGQNIVFLRNVFIYFAPELRARILRTITEKCLMDGGYLFVSMSEIAQIDNSLMPNGLEKLVDGNVFYFHKKMEK